MRFTSRYCKLLATVPISLIFSFSQGQIPAGVVGGITGGVLGGLAGGRLSISDVPGDAHQFIADSRELRPDIFRSLAIKMDFMELPGNQENPCFEYRDLVKWQARVCFDVNNYAWPKARTVAVAPWLRLDSLHVPANRIVGRIMVRGEAHDNPGYPLALWFLSAYDEELFPSRGFDSLRFTVPEKKSLAA